MTRGHIRVIILNFNQPEVTKECVDNVLSQCYCPVDIVVVDNASSDENYEVLKEALVPRGVTLLRNRVNLGYSGGNNVGARYSGLPEAEFTMMLNNDVLFRDSLAIQKMVEAVDSNIDTVAVSPLVNTIATGVPAECQQQNRTVVDFSSCIIAYSPLLRRIPYLKSIAHRHLNLSNVPYSKDTTYECQSINGCCFVIKTSFLKEIGYLDEGTFLYFEEAILSHQVSSYNKKCILTTSVVVDHYQGLSTKQNQNSFSWTLYRIHVKSQVYYCKRYLQRKRAALLLLILVRSLDFFIKVCWSFLSNLRKET